MLLSAHTHAVCSSVDKSRSLHIAQVHVICVSRCHPIGCSLLCLNYRLQALVLCNSAAVCRDATRLLHYRCYVMVHIRDR